MRSALAFVTLTTLALAGFAAPASADPNRMCAERSEINRILKDKYGEVPNGAGLSESGDAAFELYLSPTGSWTVTMTTTNGLACVMAAGRDWRTRDKVALLPKT